MTRAQALTAIQSMSTADLQSLANATVDVYLAQAAGTPGFVSPPPALATLISQVRSLVGGGTDITLT